MEGENRKREGGGGGGGGGVCGQLKSELLAYIHVQWAKNINFFMSKHLR